MLGPPVSQLTSTPIILDTRVNSDIDEFRAGPDERRFIIQLQSTHRQRYEDKLTAEQLQPLTSSIYGKMRFVLPVPQTSYHDAKKGTFTLLATASADVYREWADAGHWPHLEQLLLQGYYRITLVMEVTSSCLTAKAGLASVDASVVCDDVME